MKKITVLGAGLVGSAIIKDLAEEYSITAVDLNQKLLDKLVG
ncbi:MAG: saccharopine dehydrogenase, partial [Chloroflexi bacterium]|nr:saccharopine dehydrogenase [Chloroflexota bacterium]